MKKENIERPEPGSLPSRISFVEQMGGTAGYYVRFQSVPEEKGGPVQKYVPILQFDSQEEALQAAIQYRDRKARELSLPTEPEQFPHPEETRKKMSDSHNRIGLRGLGLTFTWKNGTAYPELSAMWSGEGGHTKVSRGMTSRGLHGAMEELVPYLKEHLHPETEEGVLLRKGAEGAARLLLRIAGREAEDRKGSAGQKRRRIEALFERWAKRGPRDRALLQELAGAGDADPAGVLKDLDLAPEAGGAGR